MRQAQIGVIGPEEKNMKKDIRELFLPLSFEIGKKIAERKGILITGGCSGVAEAASRGVQEAGGITVGTPGPERGSSVSSVTVEICTPINVGDYLFAGTLSSDAIIVFPGDAGTLAEIAIAYRYQKPLILLKGVSDGILEKLFCSVPVNYPQFLVENAEEAVTVAMRIAEEKLNKLKENR